LKLLKNLIGARGAALLVAALAAGGALLVVAPAAHASVWAAPGDTRVFPSTTPGAGQTVTLSAAGNEYVGEIIGLRGSSARQASVTWASGSDPLLTDNSVLDQVAFVRITHVTTYSGAKPGLYPDPLLPRAFGQTLNVPARSSSLYVLFHVPYGTAAGVYTGTLYVVNGAGEQVDLPVSLQVWDFGWTKLSVETAFSVNFHTIVNQVGTYQMLQQHGVTTLMPAVVPRTSSNGDIKATSYTSALQPYLGSDGLDLQFTRFPWLNWWPDYSWKWAAGNKNLMNYLANVCRVFKDNGWQDKLIAYPIDEPTNRATELRAQALAVALHKASAKAGFRAKFLLTDDPRTSTLGPMLPANTYLFNDVDIWCTRYYYFFGRVPLLNKVRREYGAQVWWYPYYNSSVRILPNFVIDKGLADERCWGWLMYRWNVDGMLYWGVNRWGNALTGKGNRDPYQNPLSFEYPDGRVANGEACLIYPGYYPRYGLDDKDAPCVSSLRLEALRDGFQDLEYCRIATKLIGAAAVRAIVARVTQYPYPVKYGHIFKFPKYAKSISVYDSARAALAQAIEQAEQAQAGS
jgi:hypothetical protein